MELQGAVCVVTGGGNGIGAALARRFAAEGAAGVVVVDLDGDAAEAVAAGLGDRGLAVAGDVAREELHQQVVASAEERFGPVDVYCSNAGTGAGAGLEASLEAWQTVWEVNTLAHVLAARAVLPSMLERGRGHLVQTASAAGLLTNLGDAAYTATKHAVSGLTKSTSLDGRPYGIACGQIDVGNAATDMTEAMAQGVRQADGTIRPEPRMAAEDVARAVVYMASLPLEANVASMTVLATTMPYVGRG